MIEESDYGIAQLAEVYRHYKGDLHRSNGGLWELCRVACRVVGNYRRGQTQQISETLGISADSLENWAKVGWMILACDSVAIQDEQGKTWTLFDLWSTDLLSFDHLLRAAKLMKMLEIDPAEILENLLLAMDGKKPAHTMEEEIKEQNEDPDELWRQSLSKLVERVERDRALFEYNRVSTRLRRAAALFVGRLKEECRCMNANQTR